MPSDAQNIKDKTTGHLFGQLIHPAAGGGNSIDALHGTTAQRDGCHVAVLGRPSLPGGDAGNGNNPASMLLDAYRQHGTDLPQHLSGDFTFLIIDEPAGRLIAATDRLGRHPLYYAEVSGGVIVASKASTLLAHPDLDADLDPQGLYHYVFFHMVPSPGTVYRGISKLPAAHRLTWSDKGLETTCYWVPEFSEAPVSEAEQGEAMQAIIRRSVASVGMGEGVGTFLSGGLDSSTVSGMLSRVRDDQARSYSIGFEAKGYDEMEYARIAARHFGLDLHEYYVTPEDVVDMVPKIAAFYDEPFGNSSALPAYFCARMAREDGITRLLAGDGGDELFGGNDRYQRQQVFELYQGLAPGLRRSVLEPLLGLLPGLWPVRKARRYVEQANMPLPDRLQSYNFLYTHDPAEVFSGDYLEQIHTRRPWEQLREVYHRPQGASALNRMLYLDWQYTLADNDLRKVSGMCELAGVEVVYPLLDDELVAFSCQLPSRVKMTRTELRRFYKRAIAGFLPEAIINKTKHGFGLPFGVWMRDHKPLRELGYDNLLKLKKRGFIRPEFIDRAIELHRSDTAKYYGELVWILMMLELWLDAHG